MQAISLGRLHTQITRSTSAGDLAAGLGVNVEVLSDRLRTLADEETWQFAARVAFTDTRGDDHG